MIRSLVVLFVAMAGSLQAGVSLATEVFRNGSEIRIEAPISVLPVSGFLPLRVELRNEGTREMRWSLTCKSSYHERGMRSRGGVGSDPITGEIVSRFAVSCPQREERSIDLLVPIHIRPDFTGGERIVTIEGSSKDLNSSLSGSMAVEGLTYVFGVSQDLLGDLNDKIIHGLSGRGSSLYRATYASVIGGEIDPDQLPKDWRAYAGYDALALSHEDYLKQEQGVKLALDQWVRAGGNLILLAESDTAPEGFVPGARPNGLGHQSLLNCGSDFDDFDGNEFVELLRKSETSLVKIETEYSDYTWLVGTELGKRTLQKSFLLVALIVFAIVVGPINLFFWAGRNRRHRLFFTTPLISLVASVLLVGFIVFRDGFGGDGARAILMEVGGPDDKTAVILQEQFSRNGVLLTSGFTIDEQTVLVPVKAPSSDLNRFDSASGKGNFNLEISKTNEGWDVSGDLFQSRSENAQVLRSVVPSRERLQLISGTSGAPQMTSSFAYPLTQVFYTDKEGGVWMASSIEPGSTVTMTATQSKNPVEELAAPVSRFGQTNQRIIKQLLERKNSFAAIAGEAPGIESHPAIDWQESPTLITGLVSQ